MLTFVLNSGRSSIGSNDLLGLFFGSRGRLHDFKTTFSLLLDQLARQGYIDDRGQPLFDLAHLGAEASRGCLGPCCLYLGCLGSCGLLGSMSDRGQVRIKFVRLADC